MEERKIISIKIPEQGFNSNKENENSQPLSLAKAIAIANSDFENLFVSNK